MRKVAFASLVGTTIEWYDYFLFGTASALVFGKVFFPTLSPTAGTLASFAILAVAFVVRPIGAVIFGHFGDRIGRKKLLVISLLITGGSTFLIGLVPTPGAIGVWAPVLLVVLRIAQGLGVSGEWGGAVLIAVEHAPPKKRGLFGSFPQTGLALGLLLATGAFALIGLLPRDALLEWGWRVPFLASSLLLIVALYVRLQISETPAFVAAHEKMKDAKAESIPIVDLLRNHWRQLVQAISLRLAGDVQGYMVTAFAVSYIVNQLGSEGSRATSAVTIAALTSVVAVPIAGYLSDRVSRKRTYLAGTVLGIVFAFPFFWLIDTNSFAAIVVAVVVMYTFAGMVPYAVQGTIYAEMFPTRVRYTGTSLSYHCAGILGGGIAPMIAAALVAWSGGSSWPISVYMVAMGLITLAATLMLKDRDHDALEPTT
ncbi:MHS family MFS transporter [Mycobacterium sp. 21AC1]|uniref:MFS transporter n=1 Tax=[Mycobacterium] appelbergii TaxID=2939269 RepID=UPI002938D952|nr:MFS transporter [Mycobacterium sp. 21AC1]MDV3124132.1 MHS family MFS transporter [Mycobacterium sp. 21AC1]